MSSTEKFYSTTDNAILLTEGDRVVVKSKTDKVFTGTVISATKSVLTVELDYDGRVIKIRPKEGYVLAELIKSKKRFKLVMSTGNWKKELGTQILDMGGTLVDSVKVPKIAKEVTVGDVMFVWYNKQAMSLIVTYIRKKVKGGVEICAEGGDLVRFYDRELFPKIIGIAKPGISVPNNISVNKLLPYLSSYNSELTRKIDPNFEDPDLSEYEDEIMSVVRKVAKSVRVKMSNFDVDSNDDVSFTVKYSKDVDIPKAKKVIHGLWGVIGNVATIESNYEKFKFIIKVKNSTSKKYLEKVLNDYIKS